MKVIEEKMGDKDVHVKCSWDGDPASWQDYIRKVRLTFEKTRSRKRKYLGPELVSQLTGRAWTVTQDIDHRMLVQPHGARFLIEFLEQRLGKVPVPDAGTKAEELFVKMRRPAGMSMASWCHKVRETYRGLSFEEGEGGATWLCAGVAWHSWVWKIFKIAEDYTDFTEADSDFAEGIAFFQETLKQADCGRT